MGAYLPPPGSTVSSERSGEANCKRRSGVDRQNTRLDPLQWPLFRSLFLPCLVPCRCSAQFLSWVASARIKPCFWQTALGLIEGLAASTMKSAVCQALVTSLLIRPSWVSSSGGGQETTGLSVSWRQRLHSSFYQFLQLQEELEALLRASGARTSPCKQTNWKPWIVGKLLPQIWDLSVSQLAPLVANNSDWLILTEFLSNCLPSSKYFSIGSLPNGRVK